MRQNKKLLLLRAVAFLLVLGLAVYGVQRFFGIDSRISYEHERGFLREERDSLDAVYIGGSDVHAFWQPCFGWKEQGIAVWNYSTDSLPMSAVKYMLIEARKTQKNAVILISLSTFKADSAACVVADVHWAADYMPLSLNKIRLVNAASESAGMTGLDRLEFFFPIIRFHTRWDSLGKWAFGFSDTDYKASMDTTSFRTGVMDISEDFLLTDEQTSVPEDVRAVVNELLDYCDAEQLQVLFVKPPQLDTAEEQGRMNALEAMVSDRGYPCLDLMEGVAETGISLKTDFYNEPHTNVHGSLKYCRVLAEYLVEHYDFTDKRGAKGWESWDEATASYLDSLAGVTLPFERDDSPRDYSLPAPVLAEATGDNRSLTLSWEGSEGADGYEIYRLDPDGPWRRIAETDTGARTFTDSGLKPDTACTYTVVPYKALPDGRAFGNFDVKGVTGKTGGAA